MRRLAVAACAGVTGRDDVFSALEERLRSDTEPEVRAQAAEILGGWGVQASPVLDDATNDADARVLEAVATAYGEIGITAPVPWLVGIAGDRDGDRLVREAAVAALGAIGDESALPVLLSLLGSGPPPVRKRAVVALTAFEGPEVEAALQTAALDRNPSVREAAEMVVGRVVEGP